ncbi:MAG: N-acetylmuramoyl-L-alanine amidase [Bacillota bacterium]|jgi:N-acetylmuramoyl-L-alanine amidase|nr:N-acetylmuramoyl-L-alanine amidase [Bacillota bacterium]HHU43775.1 hypothetical protein [Clostridiales bacterium]
MILVVKKKTLLILFLIVVLLLVFILLSINYSHAVNAEKDYKVVLDAGHGGRDAGVTGVDSKVQEKVINLAITYYVKEYLEKAGIGVVLTRTDDGGLYGDVKSNFKRTDMAKRKEIINQAKPQAVVSIHMNKFPTDSTRRGAQVFFEQMSVQSKELATALQNSLNTLNNEYAKRSFEPLKGEYYILKCSRYPSAIVECGFLSNPEEDMLLQDDEYRKKLAYQIASGIIGYLSHTTGFNSFEDLYYI